MVGWDSRLQSPPSAAGAEGKEQRCALELPLDKLKIQTLEPAAVLRTDAANCSRGNRNLKDSTGEMLVVSSGAQVGILNSPGVRVSLQKPEPAILAHCHQEEVCALITCHTHRS